MLAEVFTENQESDNPYTIESLIDEKDFENIGMRTSAKEFADKKSKSLVANNFSDAVNKKGVNLSQNTLDNFQRLFEKLKT